MRFYDLKKYRCVLWTELELSSYVYAHYRRRSNSSEINRGRNSAFGTCAEGVRYSLAGRSLLGLAGIRDEHRQVDNKILGD